MLFQQLPPGPYKRGYKCPVDLTQQHIIEYYRTLWPKTKLIIGIRHPVDWFESLYNFRVQNLPSMETMPPPFKLIGRCVKGMKLTCTEKGNFAYNLLNLGKANQLGPRPSTDLEESIVGKYRRGWFNVSEVPYTPNPVFIFDVAQLADTNETRRESFRQDMTNYLGLKKLLPPLIQEKPGMSWSSHIQSKKDTQKINICDTQHFSVRQELMRLSRQNSQWIREVFINSPDVEVSSRPFFEQIIEGYMVDPCEGNTEIPRV